MPTSEPIEIRKSLIIQKISNMSRHSIEFHNNFVKFSSLGEIQDFNKFRLINLNQITKVMGEFFQDDRIIQILTNMLQVCFILHQEIKLFDVKLSSFQHLFFAAMFLVIKLERPSMFKKLKVKACDMEIDLDTVYVLEKLILTKISWKYNLSTAAEMKFLMLSLDEKPIDGEIEALVSVLVNFSMNEYEIYSKYDQLNIAAASVLIAHNQFAKDSKCIEEAMLKLNCSIIEIEKLKEEIFYFINKNDEQANESLACSSGNNGPVNYIDNYDANYLSNKDDCVSTFPDSLHDFNEISSQISFADGSDCISFGNDFFQKRIESKDMLGRKRLGLGKCNHAKKNKTKNCKSLKGSSQLFQKYRTIPVSL